MDSLIAVLVSMMVSYAPYNVNGVEIQQEEAFCLAQNVFMEAKGENLAGKSAVAHVTLNRVKHAKYPSTVCGVTKQAKLRTNWKGYDVPIIGMCQFSWYCDGKSDNIQIIYEKGKSKGKQIGPNMEAWKQSVQVSLLALKGVTIDPTSGATHYYNHNISSPNWGQVYPVVAILSNHTFLVRND
jgi:spore germination cell wall hydrolase CwlJ-like protein|tara:strand:+ start:7019 stop:7567 length:549 start_codon:yes stop_codon:yes gene_type:complete